MTDTASHLDVINGRYYSFALCRAPLQSEDEREACSHRRNNGGCSLRKHSEEANERPANQEHHTGSNGHIPALRLQSFPPPDEKRGGIQQGGKDKTKDQTPNS